MNNLFSAAIDLIGYATVMGGQNEICFRSYQLLKRVKELLRDGVPPKYIIQLIEFVEQEKSHD